MKNDALTLVELLVATTLIGIVMVGVASFSYTIRNLQNSSNRSTLLAMEASVVSGYIVRNGMKATGFVSDPGVRSGTFGVDGKYISFRQEQGNLLTFTDDVWVIFTNNTNPNHNKLYMCTQTFAQGAVPITAGGPCSSANAYLITNNINMSIFSTNFTTLGTVTVDVNFRMKYDPNNCTGDPVTCPQKDYQISFSPPGQTGSF